MRNKKDFFPIKIAACIPRDGFKNEYMKKIATFGWHNYRVENNDDLKRIVTTFPYGVFTYKNMSELKTITKKDGSLKKESQRQGKNVLSIDAKMMIMDIDSDVTIQQASKRLDELDLKYAIVTTKRHQKEGHGDRFRIILPTDLLVGDTIDIDATKFEGNASLRKRIRERRILEYLIVMKTISSHLFPKELIEEKEQVDPQTGEITKEKCVVMDTVVDTGPFSPRGKFHPSPKDAYFFSTLDDPLKKVFKIDNTLLKEIKQEINQAGEREKQREIQKRKARAKNKEIGTYKWFKDRKEHKVIVNVDLLKSIDLGELIMHYEYSAGVTPEEINLTSGQKIIHIHGSDGAKYHINLSDDGRYFFYDYNRQEEGSQSIIDYLRNRFPQKYDDSNLFSLIREFRKDFPKDDWGVNNQLLISNPAYYLEEFLEKKAEGKPTVALFKKKHISKIDFSQNYDKMIITQENNYINTFSLEKEQQERVKEIIGQEIMRDLSIVNRC